VAGDRGGQSHSGFFLKQRPIWLDISTKDSSYQCSISPFQTQVIFILFLFHHLLLYIISTSCFSDPHSPGYSPNTERLLQNLSDLQQGIINWLGLTESAHRREIKV
jgi:hypothetical protein